MEKQSLHISCNLSIYSFSERHETYNLLLHVFYILRFYFFYNIISSRPAQLIVQAPACSPGFSVVMGDYVFESGEESGGESPGTCKLTFETISEHTGKEEAVTALHCVDSFEYKIYGHTPPLRDVPVLSTTYLIILSASASNCQDLRVFTIGDGALHYISRPGWW